jgi:hypothetical protein
VTYRPPRRRHLSIVSVEGDPTAAEKQAIETALHRMVEQERAARSPSLWTRAGRAGSRRLGMFDYRDRFDRADAWRLSVRLPFGGREYGSRYGRGDTK